LSLLAPSLRSRGVEATRVSLMELMAEMERKFPGNREKSLFASVEISLRRMSPVNQERARVLGVFHGSVDLDMLRVMMEWEEADVGSLAAELIETGLATPNPYNHLTLNPALCPYLRVYRRIASIQWSVSDSRSAASKRPRRSCAPEAASLWRGAESSRRSAGAIHATRRAKLRRSGLASDRYRV